MSGSAAGHTKHCTLGLHFSRHRKETQAKTRTLLKNKGGPVIATGSFAGQCPPSPLGSEVNYCRVKQETTSTPLQNAIPNQNIRLALSCLLSMGRDGNLSPLQEQSTPEQEDRSEVGVSGQEAIGVLCCNNDLSCPFIWPNTWLNV